MKTASDPLYRIHQLQAARSGQMALPYEDFLARLPSAYETNLTGLLLPPVPVAVKITVRHSPKFSLGRLCITAAAAQVVSSQQVLQAVARHAAGDWGDLDAHDWAANEKALRNGGRLLSVYETNGGSRFYVITESDRQVTTLLLPEDY